MTPDYRDPTPERDPMDDVKARMKWERRAIRGYYGEREKVEPVRKERCRG